ncbi:MAG TPA: HAMP domain-containing sensor histidine kinase, partial [Xanthobacteraceae bacterium]|nr:HAMP domain-containing sensor histidine kinase [Xanthobacteraceae bacterium]
AERIRRLLDGADAALAAFAPDGRLLHATPQGRVQLGRHDTLAGLGAASLAEQALAEGRTAGDSALGRVTLEKLGSDAATVLVAHFAAPAPTARVEGSSASPPLDEPAPAQPSCPAPVAPPAATDTTPLAPLRTDAPPRDRRHPMRFVWQMDAAGRFTLGSDEFTEVIGPRVSATLGRPWAEINRALALDPEDQVARAVATHDTWSGITASWPVDGSTERLRVELSGLPIYDRHRNFLGYRGFGVCRDVERIAMLAEMRRFAPPAAPQPSPAASATPAAEPAPSSVAAPELSHEARPALSLVTSAPNVVPFPGAAASEAKMPALSPVERSAFHELARELSARLNGDNGQHAAGPAGETAAPAESARRTPARVAEAAGHRVEAPESRAASSATGERPLLERIPVGILVYRRDTLLYANRAFLDWSGHATLSALAEGGGLESLFVQEGSRAAGDAADVGTTLAVANPRGDRRPIEGRLLAVPWDGETALALVVQPGARDAQNDAAQAERLAAAEARVAELETALDAAAQTTQRELAAARAATDTAAGAKSEVLAKVSHEIRTPLNSIVGFAEVMLEERFGPIGNERYRDYLRDIRAAGDHAVALLSDMLDLAKIEAGKLELAFAEINLNEAVQACVALVQPHANREQIIIRTSLAPNLPPVVADARHLRQIALKLLSNSIRLTGAGGQVIVSTAPSAAGEPVLRVRDTGIGMSENELAAALEPFRALATTTRWDGAGTGLSLPLTKALAEANRARFAIMSKINDGTLVEIAFAPVRGRVE